MTCNCSICRRMASALHFVDGPKARLTADPAAERIFRLHKHIIAHHSGKLCGNSPWAQVNLPDGTAKVALNLRMSDIDISGLPRQEFDGAAL